MPQEKERSRTLRSSGQARGALGVGMTGRRTNAFGLAAFRGRACFSPDHASAQQDFCLERYKRDRVAQRGTPDNIGVSGMQNATRLCVGGMLLFLGAASPALAQVTMLNAAADPPAEAAGVQGAVRPSDGAPNSLVVIGPVSNGGTLPSIDLNKLLSQQSGAHCRCRIDSRPFDRDRDLKRLLVQLD